jgi:ribose-phosphate pyrophosphokinase
MSKTKIFAGTSSTELALKIAKKFHKNDTSDLNSIEITKFNDGELNVCYLESVRENDVFIIQSTFQPSDNIIELFLMLDAAKRASAKKINLVIPYFGYARQDRKDKPRVPISAKLFADLMTTAGASRIITVDFHAEQLQGFFNIPVDHLSSSYIFLPYIRENYNLENIVIASPDVGGAKKASKYSKVLDVDLIIIHKERSKPGIVSKMKLIGDVEGKDVFLVDDLIDTGGSISKAADLIMEKGAKSVRALVCHPLMTGNAYDNINNSALQELIVTDTISIKKELSDKIKILSVDKMFAKAMKRIISGKSISCDIFGSI